MIVTDNQPTLRRGVQLGPGATDLGEVLDLSSRIHRYAVRLRVAGEPGRPSSRLRGYLHVREGGKSVKRVRLGRTDTVFHWPAARLASSPNAPASTVARLTPCNRTTGLATFANCKT